MKPHKHAELIKAWADGAEIEYRFKDGIKGWGEWKHFNDGRFLTDPWWEYRIKTEPKRDVVYDLRAFQHSLSVASCSPLVPHLCWPTDVSPATLRLTFDGETGKLKSAEVL